MTTRRFARGDVAVKQLECIEVPPASTPPCFDKRVDLTCDLERA